MEAMKICAILTDRANYGRLSPILQAIQAAPELELHIICGGSMVLDRFDELGPPMQVVLEDGLDIDATVFHEIEGGKHLTMALSCGEGVKAYAGELWAMQPDILILIGDRYEALAAATAAHLQNIPILHFQGGEVSGCVDNRTRHAITQLATYHVPATENAATMIRRITCGKVLAVGCPSSDLVGLVKINDDEDDRPTGPLLCVMHPTTDEDGDERKQMDTVLTALKSVPHACDLFWPNIDAGNQDIHRSIRTFIKKPKDWLKTHKNLPPEDYLHKLANTRCAVGNSSSFVRDAGFFGTPVVLIGNRQRGREHGENVIHVPCELSAIKEAIERQLEHGRYEPNDIYGSGGVSERVVAALLAMTKDEVELCGHS